MSELGLITHAMRDAARRRGVRARPYPTTAFMHPHFRARARIAFKRFGWPPDGRPMHTPMEVRLLLNRLAVFGGTRNCPRSDR